MTVTPLRPRTATIARNSVGAAVELARAFAATAGAYDESADFPYDNIARLHEAGLVARPLTVAELNPDPHPFP